MILKRDVYASRADFVREYVWWLKSALSFWFQKIDRRTRAIRILTNAPAICFFKPAFRTARNRFETCDFTETNAVRSSPAATRALIVVRFTRLMGPSRKECCGSNNTRAIPTPAETANGNFACKQQRRGVA